MAGENGPSSQETPAQQAMLLEKARHEGEVKAWAAFERQAEEMRARVRDALADFARERTSYYQRVEKEVIQLALSIARKVLRREAQIDPLLLAGMVRVALERIESGTKVVLRVHPDQLSACRAYFAQHMEPQQVPEVVEDSQLAMHHCVLETVLGTTELGPEIQLKEIEQGLFDLLGQRPEARP
jgi:flagellar assembly protein FliH